MGRENIGDLIKKTGTKLYRLPYAKEMRSWTKKPFILAGNFQTRADVEEALKNKVDFIAIGREQIFNPYIVLDSLLKADELSKDDYHWNQNPWFNPVDYSKMLEKLSQSKK
jgi:NADPH2 dehydrogenase